MPSFSLAALTVLELAPPALIDVAAACGYEHVGIRLLPAMAGGIAYPLMDDAAALKETLARLDATGITVADLEVVAFRPETEIASFAAFFETGARLGAKNILVAGYDPDLDRFTDRYAQFCEAAAPPRLDGRSRIHALDHASPTLRPPAGLSRRPGRPMPASWWMRCISTGRTVRPPNSPAFPRAPAALLANVRRPGRAAGDDGRADPCRPLRADVSRRGRHRPQCR